MTIDLVAGTISNAVIIIAVGIIIGEEEAAAPTKATLEVGTDEQQHK